MNLNNISNLCHTSSNQDGLEEVKVEFNRTFLQTLFKRPATTWVFMNFPRKGWVNYVTNKITSYEEDLLITRAKVSLKSVNDLIDDVKLKYKV